ncbi:MAG: hypothetical protein ACE145_21240 [Terriglobia bacterium]
MSNRRAFLQTSASLAVTLAARPLSAVQASIPNSLPKVLFGKYEISRLIIGSNQFYGYSHFNGLLDETMREWNTPDRVCQTLRQCEQNGINSYQFSYHDRSVSDLKRYRAANGGMHLIAVNFAKTPVEKVMKTLPPIAMYHHGEATDVLFRQGKMHEVQEYTKKLRQTGVLVGVGTHKPEVVEYVEERGWDVDFYLLCAYNRTRTREEVRKLLGVMPVSPKEVYLESDPPRAYAVARQTQKTCFLFKILAAGRLTDSSEEIDGAFRAAFESIKPKDCVIVGMYPRYKDEVKENCDRVRQILSPTS